jgi:hypothetical protein
MSLVVDRVEATEHAVVCVCHFARNEDMIWEG